MAKTPGYSGTPLATKLGLKEGHALLVWGAPMEFEAWLEPLPLEASVSRVAPRKTTALPSSSRMCSRLPSRG